MPNLSNSVAQPLRFGAVGGLNTALDVGAFYLLAALVGLPLVTANTLSYALGTLNSFLLNHL